VERDRLGLDLAVLDVDLVAAQHNRDRIAHTGQVLVPVGHVLVPAQVRRKKNAK
jgi:hypothetical protein